VRFSCESMAHCCSCSTLPGLSCEPLCLLLYTCLESGPVLPILLSFQRSLLKINYMMIKMNNLTVTMNSLGFERSEAKR
jgi:hypothetical protein